MTCARVAYHFVISTEVFSLWELSLKDRYEEFEREYEEFAPEVLSSIGQVGAAGRSGDHAKIEAARARHEELMDRVLEALAKRRRGS